MKVVRFFIWLVSYSLLIAQVIPTQAKDIIVPRRMGFTNMQLQIAPEARAAIQTKVTSLTRSPKHYRIVMERINLYMSIIEKILKEEGIPDDLKYVAIQESHLVADDISSTNAVGFWQFKQEGALEVGVRIDRYIDERMHIVASTRAFAKYVKKHYSHFNNWLYALLAFHLGRGGVKAYIKEQRWDLDGNTAIIDQRAHWYICHFLAHKLVFCDAIGKELHPELYLYECKDCQGKTIHEISQQFGVTLPKIRDYNKWLKPNKIPEDVTCSVLIPLTHQQYAQLTPLRLSDPLAKYKINYSNYWHTAKNFPQVDATKQRPSRYASIWKINGLCGTISQPGDDFGTLATKGKISLKNFLLWNDIAVKQPIEVGQIYYFKAKNSRGPIHYHIVRPQETWWSISQKYGMQLSALLSKNRARTLSTLTPGRVLWLRFIRPANIPISYFNGDNVIVNDSISQLIPIRADDIQEFTPLSSPDIGVLTVPNP